MSDFLLYASVVALFLVCILVVLVILMQRPSANAGMGAALGGGQVIPTAPFEEMRRFGQGAVCPGEDGVQRPGQATFRVPFL